MDKPLDTKHQSVFTHDIGGTDHLNGLYIRITTTINEICMVYTPCIFVTWINPAELLAERYPSGVLIIKIPDMRTSTAIDPYRKALCYIALVRSERNDATQKIHTPKKIVVQKSILLPLIELCCENNCDW